MSWSRTLLIRKSVCSGALSRRHLLPQKRGTEEAAFSSGIYAACFQIQAQFVQFVEAGIPVSFFQKLLGCLLENDALESVVNNTVDTLFSQLTQRSVRAPPFLSLCELQLLVADLDICCGSVFERSDQRVQSARCWSASVSVFLQKCR